MTYAKSGLYDTLTGNGNRQKGGALKMADLFKLINSKKDFLVKVFATLIAQLGITYYVMEKYPAKKKQDKTSFILLFLMQLTIIFVIAFVPMPVMLKLFLFTIFSCTFGVMLSFMKQFMDPKLIQGAIVATGSIFGMMFLLGVVLILSGINLGFGFGFMLWLLLLLLIIVRIIFLFTSKYGSHIKGLALFSIALFTVYIMYDTNKILQRDYYGDFITASLDYYLDILNLFINLVSYNNNN